MNTRVVAFLLLIIGASAALAAGFDGRYTALVGDLDSDSDLDIYLKHNPRIVFIDVGGIATPITLDRRPVGEFLLENANGNLSLNQSPSSADVIAARQWSENQSLTLVYEDLNFDGAQDVMIKGVASAIQNANNQVVIAATDDGEPPASLTNVDSDFVEFYSSIIGWYLDPTYFDTTLEIGSEQYFGIASGLGALAELMLICEFFYDECVARQSVNLATYYSGLGQSCQMMILAIPDDPDAFCQTGHHVWGVLEEEVTVRDYQGVLEEVVDVIVAAERTTDASGIEEVVEVLEDVIDAPIGGYDFGQIAQDNEDLDDPIEQRDHEAHRVILGGWKMLQSEERQPNTVYVTKRRPSISRYLFFYPGNWHAAIEYGADGLGRQLTTGVIAAYVDDNDKLVSKLNDPSEMSNIIVSTVTSATYPTASSLFGALVLADANYDDDLDYDYPPVGNSGAYNSNGFARGIINSVNGTSSTDWSGFFLGNKPVPNGEFQ